MTFENLSDGGLDYLPCRYGKSKLLVRGPKKRLDRPYIAMLGGSETYGKFAETPMADHVERIQSRACVNLGCPNGGTDVYLKDPSLLDFCRGADVTILEIPGAANMSNRMYQVHPRRNDRFLKASKMLRTLYHEIDFTQFHYTRHMLTALKDKSAKKYAIVAEELKNAWLARMPQLLDQVSDRVLLLWLSDKSPSGEGETDPSARGPLFICRQMIDDLLDENRLLVEVVASREEIRAGHGRMIFSDLEEPAAREMLGPVVHESAAKALQIALARMDQQKGPVSTGPLKE